MTLRNFFAKAKEAQRIQADRRHVILVRGGGQSGPDPTFARPGGLAPAPSTLS